MGTLKMVECCEFPFSRHHSTTLGMGLQKADRFSPAKMTRTKKLGNTQKRAKNREEDQQAEPCGQANTLMLRFDGSRRRLGDKGLINDCRTSEHSGIPPSPPGGPSQINTLMTVL